MKFHRHKRFNLIPYSYRIRGNLSEYGKYYTHALKLLARPNLKQSSSPLMAFIACQTEFEAVFFTTDGFHFFDRETGALAVTTRPIY
jgi:hypothetical protein